MPDTRSPSPDAHLPTSAGATVDTPTGPVPTAAGPATAARRLAAATGASSPSDAARRTDAGPGPAIEPVERAAIQRRTTRVLMVTQVIGTVGVGVAPSIGILLAGEVTDSEALAGSARTASTLGAALLGIPLGTLAARRGRRIALATGWWLAAAGAAVLVAASQWSQLVPLFAGLLLIGAGSAVGLQSRFATTDLAEPASRARALSRVVWVGAFGSMVGPNLGAPGERLGDATGLNAYAGAFLIAAACLALAGVVVFVRLRPDPLLLLRQQAPTARPATVRATTTAPRRGRVRAALTEVRTNPQARLAALAIVTAQGVMVAVMTMTPVHVDHHGGSITLVGITISLHIAGMYLLSPLVGRVTDLRGHRAAIGTGVAILVLSLVVGAVRPHDLGWIVVALILLGLGWSFANVAGSALFSSVVSDEARASSQGGVDALSNLLGAAAALVSGPLLAATSFRFLALASMVALAPLAAALLLRPDRWSAHPT